MAEPYKDKLFEYNKPILVDDVLPRLIKGQDGAFMARMMDEGGSGSEPTVGVAVQMNMAGAVLGARMVKFGRVSVKSMNAKEIWPEAEDASLEIDDFDLSDFGDFPGFMSTPYAELPFKVMVKEGDSWKALKKGELVSKGFSDLSFRLHARTVDTEKVKFTVLAVPCAVSMVVANYGESAGSRGFPGIKIHEGRAKLVTREEDESKFGIGIEPFYHVTDAKLDAQGEIVTEGLQIAGSFELKKSVVSVLQSGLSPNVHLKRGLFEEAVKANKWKKREPKVSWPNPVEEVSKESTEEGGERRGES